MTDKEIFEKNFARKLFDEIAEIRESVEAEANISEIISKGYTKGQLDGLGFALELIKRHIWDE